MKAFRSGKRVSEIMTPIAKELDDAQIRAAADWYSNVKIDVKMVDQETPKRIQASPRE